jgi:hypothetical protein
MTSFAKLVCPVKLTFARQRFPRDGNIRILDVGCGNHSPTITKHWFPKSHYCGADIQNYNNDERDLAAMDEFFPIALDGSGFEGIPERSSDLVIINPIIEHMSDPKPAVAAACKKLTLGGYIWIALPSVRSLSLPSAEGTLNSCDDDTHVRVVDVKNVSNILFDNGVRMFRQGVPTTLLGWFLAWRFFLSLGSGDSSRAGCAVVACRYLLGFEDHVFGQRRTN